VSPDVPFGYTKIPRRDGVPTHAEIQEAEAVVVRRIFDSYVQEGLTVRQIAKQLTVNRIPTPRNGGQWSWSAVDRILHEEVYIGTYYYNRKHCVPIDGAYGKKRQRFKCTVRPKEEWIPISVPPIIDLTTFQGAVRSIKTAAQDAPRSWIGGGQRLGLAAAAILKA
jgi:site-specific DNA recombinase